MKSSNLSERGCNARLGHYFLWLKQGQPRGSRMVTAIRTLRRCALVASAGYNPAMRNRSLIALLVGCLLAASGCTVWNEHPVKAFTDATGGEGLERAFWIEVKAGRWAELERHIAGNFVGYSVTQDRLDRHSLIEHLKTLHLDDYSLGDFQTELNSETMVVLYTATIHGSVDGKPLPPAPLRMMTVWQHQKAGWMAIAHTVLGPQSPS